MARRSRSYKQVSVQTKDVGSAGDQNRILAIAPLDPGVANGYLNNVQLTVLLNDSVDGEIGGFIAYLTSGNTWDDDDVITARGGSFGDTVSLTAKRAIRTSTATPDETGGSVHAWVELTDITTTTDVDLRVIAETWGRFLKVTEI